MQREYPDVAAASKGSNVSPALPPQAAILRMLRAASVRFAALPAEWLRVGYVQSNFNSDNCLVGGVGGLFTRPIAVIDPDNRKFDYEHRIAFNLGFGLRVFLNRWFSVIGEVRNYAYVEQLEATTVGSTQAQQTDPNTWVGEKPLTVNVQAQVGISIFLPFSWEYRLPK